LYLFYLKSIIALTIFVSLDYVKLGNSESTINWALSKNPRFAHTLAYNIFIENTLIIWELTQLKSSSTLTFEYFELLIFVFYNANYMVSSNILWNPAY